MDLALDSRFGEGYRSRSQWARRVTEAWGAKNLYCAACPSPRLNPHRANTKVEDFHCLRCARRLQLKAKSGRVGASVSNSAYDAKMAAIRANRAPDYAFLAYNRDALKVTDLFLVPGHFITPTVVSKRNALKATAKRHGWVGSNILLSRVPQAGKIAIVANEHVVSPTRVREVFAQTSFLQAMPSRERGWVADVMACIDRLQVRSGDRFSLADVYGFEARLQALHPRNRNVKPKIRQQLQVLRDRGLIEFSTPGHYLKL